MNKLISRHPGVAAAEEAMRKAYAPFSGFKVGAAIMSKKSGLLYPGCNVENSSFGATICAERGALLSAIAREGVSGFDYLVVFTDEDKPAVPCALCLQVLAEFCSQDFEILLANYQGIQTRTTLGALLPLPFKFAPNPCP